jgi:FO synthase subunit 1
VRDVLDCGVDDLGGVSPVTDDHINPEHEWPAVRELEAIAAEAGVPLTERLPVHHRFLPDPDATAGNEWLSDRVWAAIRADGPAGERYRAVLDAARRPDVRTA